MEDHRALLDTSNIENIRNDTRDPTLESSEEKRFSVIGSDRVHSIAST